MDWSGIRKRLKGKFGEYRYALLILVLGIMLMVLPEGEKEIAAPVSESEEATVDIRQELEEVLSRIEGVGEVCVMLTEEAGQTVLYQTDQDSATSDTSSSVKVETVIVSGTDREEEGLVRQILPPRYRGAVIVCQGGDSPRIRLEIAQAVSHLTGISTDRITILKMK